MPVLFPDVDATPAAPASPAEDVARSVHDHLPITATSTIHPSEDNPGDKLEGPVKDIEHVAVVDDPRKWSSRRKVRPLAETIGPELNVCGSY